MSKRDLKKYLNELNKEQLEGQIIELYDKFSNVNYPQTKDNNAPLNFFVAIFCCSCGFGKTYLLTKL